MIFQNVTGVKRFNIQFGKSAISSENGFVKTEDEVVAEYLRKRKDFVEMDAPPIIESNIRGARSTMEVQPESVETIEKPKKKSTKIDKGEKNE